MENAQNRDLFDADFVVDDVGISGQRQASHAWALNDLLCCFWISGDVIERTLKPHFDVFCAERTAFSDVGENGIELGQG